MVTSRVQNVSREEFLAYLRRLEAEALFDIGLTGWGEYALARFRQYPPQPRGRPQWEQGFVSDRQRRFFFGVLIRQGRVPHQRTGGLRRGWTLVNEGGMRGRVENRVPGAAYVQGPVQSRFHGKSDWVTTESFVRDYSDEAFEAFYLEIVKELLR